MFVVILALSNYSFVFSITKSSLSFLTDGCPDCILSYFFFFPRIKMTSSEPIIRSRQTEKEVNGILTQVVCTEFSNYIFVVLTQYGKIGTLISIAPDSRSNNISTPLFSTKVLLGKDEVWWKKL